MSHVARQIREKADRQAHDMLKVVSCVPARAEAGGQVWHPVWDGVIGQVRNRVWSQIFEAPNEDWHPG
jgi:hypothetical protein